MSLFDIKLMCVLSNIMIRPCKNLFRNVLTNGVTKGPSRCHYKSKIQENASKTALCVKWDIKRTHSLTHCRQNPGGPSISSSHAWP